MPRVKPDDLKEQILADQSKEFVKKIFVFSLILLKLFLIIKKSWADQMNEIDSSQVVPVAGDEADDEDDEEEVCAEDHGHEPAQSGDESEDSEEKMKKEEDELLEMEFEKKIDEANLANLDCEEIEKELLGSDEPYSPSDLSPIDYDDTPYPSDDEGEFVVTSCLNDESIRSDNESVVMISSLERRLELLRSDDSSEPMESSTPIPAKCVNHCECLKCDKCRICDICVGCKICPRSCVKCEYTTFKRPRSKSAQERIEIEGPIRKLGSSAKIVNVGDQNKISKPLIGDKSLEKKIGDVGDKNAKDEKSENDSFESYQSDVTLIVPKDGKPLGSNENDQTKEINNNGDNSIIVSSLIGFDLSKIVVHNLSKEEGKRNRFCSRRITINNRRLDVQEPYRMNGIISQNGTIRILNDDDFFLSISLTGYTDSYTKIRCQTNW